MWSTIIKIVVYDCRIVVYVYCLIKRQRGGGSMLAFTWEITSTLRVDKLSRPADVIFRKLAPSLDSLLL